MSLLLWCGVLGLFLFRHTSSDRFLRRCRWVSSSTRTPNNPSKRKRILTPRPPSPTSLFPSPLHLPDSPSLSSFPVCVVVYLFCGRSSYSFARLFVRPFVCFVSFSFLSAYSFVYVCLIVCVSFPVLVLTQDIWTGVSPSTTSRGWTCTRETWRTTTWSRTYCLQVRRRDWCRCG